MSLTPIFNEWWDDIEHVRGLDQYFRSPIDHHPHNARNQLNYPLLRHNRHRNHLFHPFHRALVAKRQRGCSFVQRNKDNFFVSLDVQQFGPEEISVKVVDKNVVVEAKHEEVQDEHGSISRRFVRRLVIPEDFEVDRVETFLSSDGILMITAPRKKVDFQDERERIIPIQFTGALTVVEKKDGDSEGDGSRPVEPGEKEDDNVLAA